MRKTLFFLLLSVTALMANAQADVLHYRYELELRDTDDSIRGVAKIRMRFSEPVDAFRLDLMGSSNGKGMKSSVAGNAVHRAVADDTSILVTMKGPAVVDSVYEFRVSYSGVPADGLIIASNKFGDRTFFADNWPNRARHWIPCMDRPDDKASFEFIVTAPSHYRVISNGKKIAEENLDNGFTRTHWKEEMRLPTKVMVIGVARFAIKQYADSPAGIPVSAWVYPQDSTYGFTDYAAAASILKFFTEYIGPYPFNKLANVQSKTIFGGMENAGAIFYNESLVKGNADYDDLLAHEIAHQWFGNMASEKSFTHLWLSEGFATYLTNIYVEAKYGKKMMKERLRTDREMIIRFVRTNDRPVVDAASAYMDLLNANSYQKGGWILHMLRREVGDTSFQKILQMYYSRFSGSNADSKDFEMIAEEVSGKELTGFFHQWLDRPGIPKLAIKKIKKAVGWEVTVMQTQKEVYELSIPVGLRSKERSVKEYWNIAERVKTFFVPGAATEIRLDPDVELLWEEVKN